MYRNDADTEQSVKYRMEQIEEFIGYRDDTDDLRMIHNPPELNLQIVSI